MRRIDHIVLLGIGLLVVFTPVCFGSVHPWAYSFMEQVSFALIVAWTAKAWLDGGRWLRSGGRAAAAVVLPITLLLGLLALETVPLPPALLARLSPATYNLYAQVLPGWPSRQPYQNIDFSAAPRPLTGPMILPTAQQVRAGAPVPFAPSASAHGHSAKGGVGAVKPAAPATSAAIAAGASARIAGAAGGANRQAIPSTAGSTPISPQWRALSFEPAVTRAILLKGLAYAAIFLLIALYPFGTPGEPRSEEHFCRAVLAVAMVTGLGIAFLGLANWATWNGKILWFFVPLDWGKPYYSLARASGPFVDPDHFANYLSMVFPFALAGALFRIDLVSRRWATPLRLASVLIAFIIVCALLLSLSRGAWAGTVLGVLLLILLFFLQGDKRRAVFARHANARALKWAGVGILGLVVLAVLFVGPQGRTLSAARLSPGASQLTIGERATMWHGSLAMVREFPLFGVGLGTWGELFTRYAPRPWSPFFFYREAHNDYLQFTDEAGVLGMLVLFWLAWRILSRIVGGLRTGDARKWPILAAVLAATGAVALHETVDFSLQIPANAMLLAILLGLGLRVATARRPGDEIRRRRTPRPVLALAAVAALVLIVASVGQHDIYYPDFLPKATTVRAAVARIDAHPVDSEGHFILANLGEGLLSRQAQLRELHSAVWLDPTNPHKRDLYASVLAKRGELGPAEAQVTRSIFNSPSPDTHFYLSPELVHWLAPATRIAVERGFREAMAARIPGALKGLGDFYALSDLPLKEAQLDSTAAGHSNDPERRLRLLLGAGQAYAAAGYMTTADAIFQFAISQAPNSPQPYLDIVRSVYGPDRDMRSARQTIDDAVKAGQDPYKLNMGLASAAGTAGDAPTEEAALRRALAVIPDDLNALTTLGEFYLNQGRYDDALMTFERAAESNPDSAQIRFDLGNAQEHSYHYYDAERSYARAVALAPGNRYWAEYYSQFKQRMVREAARLDDATASHPAAAAQPAAEPTPALED